MTEFPHTPWAQFYKQFASRWAQGEHVFINGQTGSGKTELLLRIMELRTYSTIMVTKPRDPIFKSPFAKGYKRMTKFAPTASTKRILLSAPSGDSTTAQVGNQQEVFKHALDNMYAAGGWAIGVDETLWISNRLRLGSLVGDASFMGRALGISVVAATQRPAHIPVIIPQSATHAFLGKTGRKGDLKTLAELGGDPRETERAIASLRDQHDFVYVDTQGKMPLQIVNTRA
jgi:energy-coupling factor transporter ATP-binding protein EcfA2